MKTKADYQEIANRVRIDMDGRGPRVRLSMVGYLTDNDVTPESVGGVDEWLDLIKRTVDWIGEDYEAYVTMIENLDVVEGVTESDDTDAYSILDVKPKNQGYL